MLVEPRTSAKIAFLLVTCGLGSTHSGFASTSENEYRQSLQIAEQKVARSKILLQSGNLSADSSSALSSPTVARFFGRPYRVDDTWVVAAWQSNPGIARMTSDPQSLRGDKGKVGLFQYRVIEVKNSPVPEVSISIRQLNSRETPAPVIDERVEKILLKMNDSTIQTHKSYVFKTSDGSREVTVAPEGLRSRITQLELFPLDVPEVASAAAVSANAFPELPQALQAFFKQRDTALDLGRTLRVEQDDFFGRPVTILWQQGEPWPAYLKTTQGIAILIAKGNI